MKASSFWCKIVAFILPFFFLSCAAGNNALTRTAAYPKAIERAKKDKRYFIMHSGVDTFAVSSVLVEKRRREFTVHLEKLDSAHRAVFANPALRTEKQIHLFMRDATSYTLDEPHTIPLQQVARIELLD